MSFEPSIEQGKAFIKVADAIREAKKLGLVFYGKTNNLVAYTSEAVQYVNQHGLEKCLDSDCSQINCLDMSGLIEDSGADDYPKYINKEDEEKYA